MIISISLYSAYDNFKDLDCLGKSSVANLLLPSHDRTHPGHTALLNNLGMLGRNSNLSQTY